MNSSTALSVPTHDTSSGARRLVSGARLWRLLATSEDWAATLARAVLAAVLFPHGAQHLAGWFGGYGFSGTHGWMTGTLGIPSPVAALSIVFEFFSPFVLLLGVGGRLTAAGIAVFLAVAATTHRANGFFMNWLGTQAGEGFEYHLLAIALALTVVLRGSGALSVDGWLVRRRAR